MKRFAAAVVIAVTWAAPQGAAAQTGTAPFCLQTQLGTRCVFSTMGECEAYRGNTSPDQCMTRADAQGTTGLGNERSPPSMKSGEQPPPGPYFPNK